MRHYSIMGVLFLFTLFCLSGCFPAVFLSRPAASGRLVDAEGKSIANMDVTVRYEDLDKTLAAAQTNSDGRFRFSSDGERGGVYFLMQDSPRPPIFVLENCVKGKTYTLRTFRGNKTLPLGLGSREIQFGDIMIDRK